MLTAETIDRLKAQLLTSGLSQRDQPLFQVINLLIDAARQSFVNFESISGSGGGGGGGGSLGATFLTKNNETPILPNSLQVIAGAGIQFNDAGNRRVISTAIPFGMDSGESEEDGPQGPPGLQGIQGLTGPAGSNALSIFYAIDAEDGEDGQPGIPGPQGFAGTIGATGPPGILGTDGLDGEDGMDGMPGPSGSAGATGATGQQGLPGIPGQDAEELEIPFFLAGSIGDDTPPSIARIFMLMGA